MGLPRAHRMARRDFRRRATPTRRVSVGPFVVQASGSPSPEPTVRIGFAVGKPVGGAVVRNLVRRRLREAAVATLPLWQPESVGAILVLVRARPGADRVGTDGMRDLLTDAAVRLSRQLKREVSP